MVKIGQRICYHTPKNHYIEKCGKVKKINEVTIVIDSEEKGIVPERKLYNKDDGKLNVGDSVEFYNRSNQKNPYSARIVDVIDKGAKGKKFEITYTKPVKIRKEFLSENFDEKNLIKKQENIGKHVAGSSYDKRRQHDWRKKLEESMGQKELMEVGAIKKYDKSELMPPVDFEKERKNGKSLGHIFLHNRIQSALGTDRCQTLHTKGKLHRINEKECHEFYYKGATETKKLIDQATTLQELEENLYYHPYSAYSTSKFDDSTKEILKSWDAKHVFGKSFINYLKKYKTSSVHWNFASTIDHIENGAVSYPTKLPSAYKPNSDGWGYRYKKEDEVTIKNKSDLEDFVESFVNPTYERKEKKKSSPRQQYNEEFKRRFKEVNDLTEKRFGLHDKPIEKIDDSIRSRFGIRTIQYGVTLKNDKDFQRTMVELTYGSLQDLSEVLKVDPSIIGLGVDPDLVISKSEEEKVQSLSNNLALALGARSHGGSLAHYEPSQNIINLTKKKGNGTIAHEWGHALDKKLADEIDPSKTKQIEEDARKAKKESGEDRYIDPYGVKRWMSSWQIYKFPESAYTKPFASHIRSVPVFKQGDGDRKFGNEWFTLVDSIRKSKFCTESAKLDKRKPYWGSPEECFARAFESYVGDKTKNRFLALDTKANNGFFKTVYPQGDERKTLNKKFDDILKLQRLSHIIQS